MHYQPIPVFLALRVYAAVSNASLKVTFCENFWKRLEIFGNIWKYQEP